MRKIRERWSWLTGVFLYTQADTVPSQVRKHTRSDSLPLNLFLINTSITFKQSIVHLQNSYSHLCRDQAEELERAWWNEQAELSLGPDAAGKVPEDQVTSTEWQVRPDEHST